MSEPTGQGPVIVHSEMPPPIAWTEKYPMCVSMQPPRIEYFLPPQPTDFPSPPDSPDSPSPRAEPVELSEIESFSLDGEEGFERIVTLLPQMPRLQTVHLKNIQLIPDTLQDFSVFSSLVIEDQNSLNAIAPYLGQMPNLHTVYLRNIDTIPHAIGPLATVTTLVIEDEKTFVALLPYFAQRKSPRIPNLQKIVLLPDSANVLSRLTALAIGSQEVLNAFRPYFTQMSALTSLFLKNIHTLPDTLPKVSQLDVHNLHPLPGGKNLLSLPESFTTLKDTLKVLRLKGTQIGEIPPSQLSGFTNLHTLEISSNAIGRKPAKLNSRVLGTLSGLKRLVLSDFLLKQTQFEHNLSELPIVRPNPQLVQQTLEELPNIPLGADKQALVEKFLQLLEVTAIPEIRLQTHAKENTISGEVFHKEWFFSILKESEELCKKFPRAFDHHGIPELRQQPLFRQIKEIVSRNPSLFPTSLIRACEGSIEGFLEIASQDPTIQKKVPEVCNYSPLPLAEQRDLIRAALSHIRTLPLWEMQAEALSQQIPELIETIAERVAENPGLEGEIVERASHTTDLKNRIPALSEPRELLLGGLEELCLDKTCIHYLTPNLLHLKLRALSLTGAPPHLNPHRDPLFAALCEKGTTILMGDPGKYKVVCSAQNLANFVTSKNPLASIKALFPCIRSEKEYELMLCPNPTRTLTTQKPSLTV